MTKTEKYLPFILSATLPGLNIVNNNPAIEDYNWESILPIYAMFTLFLLVIWYANHYFLNRNNGLTQFLGRYGVIALGNFVLIMLLMGIDDVLRPEGVGERINNWVVVFRLSLVVCMFLVIQQVFKTIRDREALKIQNLSLQAENLKSQLETMKQQVNPHFLFNSLNTLMDFIEDDKEQAVEFVRSFSNLYRVVLQSSRRDFVLLGDELKFLEDYWNLLKMRFDGAIELHNYSKLSKTGYLIPPLSLQLLIENAVKHNLATHEKPLVIEILGQGSSIIVQNTLTPKAYKEKGEGVGLMNLQKRFTLLHHPIHYGVEGDKFKVTLPLKTV